MKSLNFKDKRLKAVLIATGIGAAGGALEAIGPALLAQFGATGVTMIVVSVASHILAWLVPSPAQKEPVE